VLKSQQTYASKGYFMKLKSLILLPFLLLSSVWSFAPEYFNQLAIQEERQTIDVVPYLELEKGDVVADLGAGGGYFSLKLAKEVGEKGIVYAVDIDKKSIEYIKTYAKSNGVENVKVVLAKNDDARLPKDTLDLIFIRNTYHHLPSRVAYFKNLADSLKPKGKIAIIDYLPEKTNYAGHSSDVDMIIDEMKKAGFVLYKQYDKLKRQSFLIFSKED
jgi:ubiquinone/menaquinone biosynthesis C-methylase UbiE